MLLVTIIRVTGMQRFLIATVLEKSTAIIETGHRVLQNKTKLSQFFVSLDKYEFLVQIKRTNAYYIIKNFHN